MSFFNRIQGVFFKPKETFQSLSEKKKPAWLDVLAVIMIAGAAYGYLVAPFQKEDTVQMMENNGKLREKMGEERFNQMLTRTKNTPSIQTAATAFASVPIGCLIASALLFGFGRMFSVQGQFLQVFSVTIHAHLINLILGNALRLILVFGKKSVMQMSTGLLAFFPKLEVMSTPSLLLGAFDFFELWMYGVLGLGLAAVFKIGTKKAMMLSYGFWFLKTIVKLAVAFIFKSWLG